MPRTHKLKFILSNQDKSDLNKAISTFLDNFSKTISDPLSDLRPSALEDLDYVCGLMVEKVPRSWDSIPSKFSKDTFLKILTLVVNIKHQRLFERVSSQSYEVLKLDSEWVATQYELAVSSVELKSAMCCQRLLRVADTWSHKKIVKM